MVRTEEEEAEGLEEEEENACEHKQVAAVPEDE